MLLLEIDPVCPMYREIHMMNISVNQIHSEVSQINTRDSFHLSKGYCQ